VTADRGTYVPSAVERIVEAVDPLRVIPFGPVGPR